MIYEYNKPTRCNSGSIIIRRTIYCNSSHWCLSWVGME